jgi:hypothetical protein
MVPGDGSPRCDEADHDGGGGGGGLDHHSHQHAQHHPHHRVRDQVRLEENLTN